MPQPSDREIEIFNAALELAASERGAYLAQVCAGDDGLRQQVEELLRAEDRAGGFLESPQGAQAGVSGSIRPVAMPETKLGDRIGRYKLLEQIGEGGCGVVYMAEQEEPVRRRVALKVIKLGMDTKSVVARFEAERQALALMDHPNIAKVLDAGATETGRPYFVMELVRGVKITDYCDQNHLSTHERLAMFIQVCQAIQHAHQKGIIHRDIKPSNILVTVNDGVAVPKVIDFGIAKATQGKLTDQTLFTAFEQFLGTPAYMSPEQAAMTTLDIDTRSDIYSLGVLLYELLTGRTPFDQKELLAAGLDQMRRTILEREPPRPSTRLTAMAAEALTMAATTRHTDGPRLVHLVRGDLDWIVMKALEKDRGRRYETANDFAFDIDRHLGDEPVIARPAGALYRFQKAARRHKGVFAGTATIACVLVIAAVVSSMQAIRARSAQNEQVRLRQIAQVKERKSEQVAQLLKDIIRSIGPSVALGRDTTIMSEVLGNAAEHIARDMTNQPDVAVELYLTLADTYHDLGLYKDMEAVARQSLLLIQKSPGEENEGLARTFSSLGDALMHFGQLHLGEIHASNQDECQRRLRDPDLSEAEKLVRRSLALNRKLFGNENAQVAGALNLLANVQETQGRWADAENLQREALTMQKKLVGNEDPKVAKLLYELAAFLSVHNDRLAEAESLNREALALQRKLLGHDHPQIAKSLFDLADVLENEGKLTEAEDNYREVVAMWKNLHANDRIDASDALNHLALLLMREGKLAEAETRELEALAMERRLVGNQDAMVADSLNSLGVILMRQGKLGEAEARLREALEIQRKQPGDEHADVGGAVSILANVLQLQGKLVEAKALIEGQTNATQTTNSEPH